MTKPLDPIEATTASRAGKAIDAPHASADAEPPAHAACANCGTALAGEYCHHCGQYAHNPLTSFRHAVEDVFESVWHLDGRIFRTLRELFLPGRVARGYLAGHRVRYIPPLRLFVILSLLTFFVGKLVLHADVNPIRTDGVARGFAEARTVEEVRRREAELLVPIEAAEQARTAPGMDASLIAARVRIQGEAATRIAQLRDEARTGKAGAPASNATQDDTASGESAQAPRAETAPASNAAAAAAAKAAAPNAESEERDGADTWTAGDGDTPFVCRFNGKAWHATDNPVRVAWLPGFAEKWFNKRVGRTCDNLRDADRNGERLFQQFLGAVPTALFLLMPVFALLLKLCFLGSGRSYLEHLVVALYSHCFLLLMLMTLFLLVAAGNAGVAAWLTGLGYAAVWIFMPIYLWLMQRRVYGGGWWINALRYVVIGWTYVVLVSLATAYAALQGISS
jgi:hypothetical protein